MSTQLHIGRSRIFIIGLISFLAGVFSASFLKLPINYWYFEGLLILITLAVCFKNRFFFIILCWVSCLLFGAWYLNYYQTQKVKTIPDNINLTIVGQIVDEPDIREAKTKLSVEIKDIEKIDSKDVQKQLIGQKILVDSCRYPEFFYGDIVKINGNLLKPPKIKDFDYGAYLRLDDISAILYACEQYSGQSKIELIFHNRGNKIYYYVFRLKSILVAKLNQLFPEPSAGLLSGILFGTKKAISATLSDNLNKVGLTHIVVVSGYHVVILMQIFVILTRNWPKKLSFISGTAFLVLFSIFVGMGASVIRSVIMAWLVLLAKILGRKSQITNVVIVTCTAMVALNPLIVRDDVGFQLSFLSFLGIVYVGPLLIKYFKRLGLMLSEIITSTLGAQIMTLPIIIVQFKRLSFISPLTNILIVPIIPATMLGEFIAVIVGLANQQLGFIISWPTQLLINYMMFIIDHFSSWRFAAYNININNWYLILIYYAIIILIIYLKNKAKNKAKTYENTI